MPKQQQLPRDTRPPEQAITIRLRVALPVAPAHGLTEGLVCAVVAVPTGAARGAPSWWVRGVRGELVGVMEYEATIIGSGTGEVAA